MVVATVTSMTKALVQRFRVCTGYAGRVDGADQRQASCHAMPCHVYATKFLLITVLFLPPTNIPRLYTEKITIKTMFWKTQYAQSQVTARGKRGPEHSGKTDPRSFKAVSASGPSQRVANSTLALARPASVRRERSPVRAHAPQTVSRDNARRAHSQSVETRRSCQTSQLLRRSSPTRTCF